MNSFGWRCHGKFFRFALQEIGKGSSHQAETMGKLVIKPGKPQKLELWPLRNCSHLGFIHTVSHQPDIRDKKRDLQPVEITLSLNAHPVHEQAGENPPYINNLLCKGFRINKMSSTYTVTRISQKTWRYAECRLSIEVACEGLWICNEYLHWGNHEIMEQFWWSHQRILFWLVTW